MNLKRFKVAFAAILMVGTVFTACSGEDGVVGPVGATGNANVNTFTYSRTAADFDGAQIKTDTIDAPAITRAILDDGDISSFISFSASSDVWYPTPYREIQFLSATTVTTENIIVSYDIGKIYLSQFTDNLGNQPIRDFTLKLVTIPSAAKIDGVNEGDYEELKAVYGLTD